MARREVPASDYDQGYFSLHSDGSVTPHFRVSFFGLETDRAYAEVDLDNGEFRFPHCQEFPRNNSLHDPNLLLQCISAIRIGQCPTVGTEFRYAAVEEEIILVDVYRERGASFLVIRGRDRFHTLVHHGETWTETDELEDAHDLWKALKEESDLTDETRPRGSLRSWLRATVVRLTMRWLTAKAPTSRVPHETQREFWRPMS